MIDNPAQWDHPARATHGGPLAGIVVLVTRPAHQADALTRRIEAAGGQVVCFPAIEIAYLDNRAAFSRLAEDLDAFDFCIFVSANAVTGWIRLLEPHRRTPLRARLVAVGAGTTTALEKAGLPSPLCPRRGSGSEALLELPELSGEAVAGRRILIVRGIGGRELLGDTLAARGASVEYVETYRRRKPKVASEKLLAQRGKVDAIVVTSTEALKNLFAIGGVEAKPWLSTIPLVTVSERVGAFARAIGAQRPAVVAKDASDEAIVASLARWHQHRCQSVNDAQQRS